MEKEQRQNVWEMSAYTDPRGMFMGC